MLKMSQNMFTRIKICCISSVEEASMAIKYGADAIGLVGPMPSGPGMIPDEQIKRIAKSIPPGVDSFLLSSETNAEKLIAHYEKVHTRSIQIVDQMKLSEYALLREKLPMVKLIQVIHVIDETSLDQAKEVADYVDAILLDSGNPNLEVKELGGTGRTHNWQLSRQIREALDLPVYLAGGLNPENIREAIEVVQPFGVDLCSGVRTNGKLDETKLGDFISQFNKAT